jgi:hypothetical protein
MCDGMQHMMRRDMKRFGGSNVEHKNIPNYSIDGFLLHDHKWDQGI